MELAVAIRQIRQRLGLSQAALAAELGLKQGVVSQYERGRTTPSTRILLILREMAEGEELQAIERALDADFSRKAAPIRERLEKELERLRALPPPEPERQKFFELARSVTMAKVPPPPELCRILELWREHSENRRIKGLLRQAAAFIEVSLGAPRERRRPAGPYKIFIRCPQTKRLVDTKWTTDSKKDWEDFDPMVNRHLKMEVQCPHCGGYHQWSKADAILRRAS